MLCGTNMSDIKISNRSAILRLLHEEGAMSRKQIAARLKLTPATITVIINELMNEGILVEGISVPNAGAAGRREVMVEISRSKHVALGIAFGSSSVLIAVVNLHGERIHAEELGFPDQLTPQAFVEKTAVRIRELIREQGYPEDYIIGLGITICGVVD
ncbi:MAG: winged helix-turn-helix transcriptional regulator, partial [Acetatifactor sp.]|nr:winged helix-turn-helix transcriptional regulator [Acetatifactor sp.]